MDDRELVKRILGGDQVAMRELVVKYQDLVVNTCFQVLHNRPDAEDVAQDVFLEAYRSLGSLRSESSLSYWLYRISLNKSINQYNKNRIFRKVIRLDHIEDPGESRKDLVNQKVDDPVQQDLEEEEKLEVIIRMIDTLPVRQRKAFILHHIERLSYKEIGEVLQLSLSSVESLIFRARTTLKEKCRAFYEQNKQPV